jgi:hypothetical protein
MTTASEPATEGQCLMAPQYSVQTISDHEVRKQRLAGREGEIAIRLSQLKRTIGTRQVKRSLLKFAQDLARSRHFPLVPRLERRHLDLLVAWFIDHYPAVFDCPSLQATPSAGLGPQPAAVSAQPGPVPYFEDPWDLPFPDFSSPDDPEWDTWD